MTGGCRECPNPCGNFHVDNDDLDLIKKERKTVGGLTYVALPCVPLGHVKPELLHIYDQIDCLIDKSGNIPMIRFHMEELTKGFAERITPFLTEGGKTLLINFLQIADSARVQRSSKE